MSNKIIVSGSRNFNDVTHIYDHLDMLVERLSGWNEIVTGGAKGVDTIARDWARDNDLKSTVFPADWRKYGKSAGIVRNTKMGDYADSLIAFWDFKSPGTRHMINYMVGLRKPVIIVGSYVE